jgi:hypothetical protein
VKKTKLIKAPTIKSLSKVVSDVNEVIAEAEAEVKSMVKKLTVDKDAEPEKPIEYVLWTGGFDSTSLVLKYNREKRPVQPIYMKHSGGSPKCGQELAAQARIRKLLPYPYLVKDSWVVDYDQWYYVPALKALSKVMDELATVLGISYQWSALRFCKEVMGWEDDLQLQISVVSEDDLWYRVTATRGTNGNWSEGLTNFFKGFKFPILDLSKREIWDAASEEDRRILAETYSCEHATGDEKHSATCVYSRPYAKWCKPCLHRLPNTIEHYADLLAQAKQRVDPPQVKVDKSEGDEAAEGEAA